MRRLKLVSRDIELGVRIRSADDILKARAWEMKV